MSTVQDDVADKRKHRSKYIKLIEEARNLLANAEDGTLCFEETKTLSREGLKILTMKDSTDLEIALLDMDLMNILYKIIHLNLKTLNPEKFEFDPADFAKRILRYCNEGSPGHNDDPASVKLCRKLATLSGQQLRYGAPGLSTMVGALQVTEQPKKPKIPKEKKTRDIIEPVKKPEQVARVEGRTLEETVLAVGKQLNKHYLANDREPINFLKFIIDPSSFSRTVENLFHVAFLINNCDATIFYDDEGMPVIAPEVNYLKGKSADKTREDKNALVMTITPDEWKEAIEVMSITRSMIKLSTNDDAVAGTSGVSQKRKK